MSPRTRRVPPAGPSPLGLLTLLGALALLGACGAPPQPLPTSPPYTAASAAPVSLGPSLPVVRPLPTLTGYPTITANPAYPTYPAPTLVPTTTTAPTSKPATPTPSHAGRCSSEPTGAQILALIKGQRGVPKATLRVFEGPFCSGTWSFTTVEVAGQTEDQVEPLMVVSTGKNTTLALVAAGSDVCVDRVQTEAPPGVRVLACGF